MTTKNSVKKVLKKAAKKASASAKKSSAKKMSVKKSSAKKMSAKKVSTLRRGSKVKKGKPLSPECQKMLDVRKRFNIKAFEEGTVFKSGHRYLSKKDAISAAFNQLRKARPDCFET